MRAIFRVYIYPFLGP